LKYREALARFVRSIEVWTIKAFDLKATTDVLTKRNINRWIAELKPTWYKGILAVNTAASLEKITEVNKLVGLKTLEEAFKNRVKALSSIDLSEATVLQRSIKNTFGKNWKRFYDEYDVVLRNYPSKPLATVQRAFLNKARSDKMLTFVGGTKERPINYAPKNYASMVGRTRSSEVSTTLQFERMEELGMNLVRVTNANTVTPICTLFEDKYFSTDGKDLPSIEVLPPFHPNCRHLIGAVAGGEKNIAKYKAFNKIKDKQIASKKAEWTDAERKQVDKQLDWLKNNRPV